MIQILQFIFDNHDEHREKKKKNKIIIYKTSVAAYITTH